MICQPTYQSILIFSHDENAAVNEISRDKKRVIFIYCCKTSQWLLIQTCPLRLFAWSTKMFQRTLFPLGLTRASMLGILKKPLRRNRSLVSIILQPVNSGFGKSKFLLTTKK